MSIRVVLVDDQEMIRRGFRMLLESRPEIEVVGEAGDGASAIQLLTALETDVVLMDVRMPGIGGVEATRRITTMDRPPRVLILTTFDLDEYAYAALQAGASGFLVKDAPLEDLTAAIRHVHEGDAVVAPSTTRRLLTAFASSAPPRRDRTEPNPRFRDLTPREHEVMLFLARGRSNAEIAAALVLTEGTVKVHVGRILAKLGLRDRVQAVVLAYEEGLVEPGSPDIRPI